MGTFSWLKGLLGHPTDSRTGASFDERLARAAQAAIGLVELEGVAVTPAVRRWLTQYAQQQISQRELIAKIEAEVAALMQHQG